MMEVSHREDESRYFTRQAKVQDSVLTRKAQSEGKLDSAFESDSSGGHSPELS